MSSWVASKMAASSATRGWKSCDLLLRVDGRGVGSGNTGNTETIRFCAWKHYVQNKLVGFLCQYDIMY